MKRVQITTLKDVLLYDSSNAINIGPKPGIPPPLSSVQQNIPPVRLLIIIWIVQNTKKNMDTRYECDSSVRHLGFRYGGRIYIWRENISGINSIKAEIDPP